MDTKAAFDREAFENAAAELTGYKPEFILSQRTGDDYKFGSGLNACWHFWRESRAAIEIEKEPEHEWMGEYPSHDSFLDGYANGWNDCVDSITSRGIRIKGKTE